MSTPLSQAQRNGVRKKIGSHPFLVGLLVGLVLCSAIIVADLWFPWAMESVGKRKPVLEGVFFTCCFFGAYTYFFWRWHSRRGFWTKLGVFFAAHAVGVGTFSFYVHPLLPWQWSVLGFLEAYAGAFLVGWTWRGSDGADSWEGDQGS